MKGTTLILHALHHSESSLARELLATAERHRTEHEVHHVAVDLAQWSRRHSERLTETAAHYDVHLSGPPDKSTPGGILATLREKAAETVGRRPEPALLLLLLHDLNLAATENSLYWEMLAQAAQAGKDRRLLDLAACCHPQTLRQMRWSNTLIKVLSAQALTSL
ncbi:MULTISPECIES: hypothetical protein [unclassified Streptomyces]|uniref:hypothetical protein n=1 Tax=unclassified Streptomyces TaxID=2593676 RepID=UPI000BD9A786|nr:MULTISPECIES: hypothetical protein [unclassified Streptomyces]MDN3250119.1 hypothetical protein [Streptomyces sp. ZSW22]MDN3257683.1 hypothetical protein [Streptomyces sp. MA25(2023)]PAK26258.1 hypothetical protein CJD44_11305 [Streptomyces sp. alain-838]